jgi:hypothetical protein
VIDKDRALAHRRRRGFEHFTHVAIGAHAREHNVGAPPRQPPSTGAAVILRPIARFLRH